MMNKIQVLILLLFCAACTYQNAEEEYCLNIADTVSFNKDIVPIFNAHCNSSGCHSGKNPAGGLSLEASVAYSQLLKKGSGYVDTLKPQYSILYLQMKSKSDPMPPSGRLNDCKINAVYTWIQQKAHNN